MGKLKRLTCIKEVCWTEKKNNSLTNTRYEKLFSVLIFMLTSFIFSCEDDQIPYIGDCVCYEIYAPVCDSDGNIYENDCKAKCQGVLEYTTGNCKN